MEARILGLARGEFTATNLSVGARMTRLADACKYDRSASTRSAFIALRFKGMIERAQTCFDLQLTNDAYFVASYVRIASRVVAGLDAKDKRKRTVDEVLTDLEKKLDLGDRVFTTMTGSEHVELVGLASQTWDKCPDFRKKFPDWVSKYIQPGAPPIDPGPLLDSVFVFEFPAGTHRLEGLSSIAGAVFVRKGAEVRLTNQILTGDAAKFWVRDHELIHTGVQALGFVKADDVSGLLFETLELNGEPVESGQHFDATMKGAKFKEYYLYSLHPMYEPKPEPAPPVQFYHCRD